MLLDCLEWDILRIEMLELWFELQGGKSGGDLSLRLDTSNIAISD